MAVVSRELGYLFIHAPRTGGTALANGVLIPRLRGTRIPATKLEVEARGERRLVRQHATRAQLLEAQLIDAADADRLLTFTTVRNPFDSLVSAYVKKRDTVPGKSWAGNHPVTRARVAAAAALPFPAFIEEQYGGRKPRHLYAHQLDGADVVMRFEQLQADFDGVLDRLGIAHVHIPVSNTTSRDADYRSYYTPRAREIVADVFAPDLERFGYEF